MIFAKPVVPAFPDQIAIPNKHAANHGVWLDFAFTHFCQLKGPQHPDLVNFLLTGWGIGEPVELGGLFEAG
jgi:hypothetical protein